MMGKNITGFVVAGHFIYRANGGAAPTWCGKLLRSPFQVQLQGSITCERCQKAINRAYRRMERAA